MHREIEEVRLAGSGDPWPYRQAGETRGDEIVSRVLFDRFLEEILWRVQVGVVSYHEAASANSITASGEKLTDFTV